MLQRISGAPCHLQVGLTPVILEGFIFQVASSARSGARTLGPAFHIPVSTVRSYLLVLEVVRPLSATDASPAVRPIWIHGGNMARCPRGHSVGLRSVLPRAAVYRASRLLPGQCRKGRLLGPAHSQEMGSAPPPNNQHMGLHFKCMGDKSEQHCTIYNS